LTTSADFGNLLLSFLNELKRRNVLRVGAAYIVAAWLIIQVSETIFPLFGYGDTPARLIVIVLAIAFIPSLIFSWVFEITPEGLKRDADVDREQSITHVTGKKLDRVILVVLALALAYFAFDKFVLVPTRVAEIVEETTQKVRSDVLVESYGDKSIAVLPFVNMSDDASNEYFSDGISEELLNLLAKIPELRVIARTSSFSYKGKDVKVADLARELNVGHVLEGSVRKAGNRVRITAQLIEARSETHLWSENYDRSLDDIFAIQDEIAAAVVTQLKVTLLGAIPMVCETDPQAYALYLQGRHLRLHANYEGNELAQAQALLQQALVIDSGYAAAWDELGYVYYDQAMFMLRPLGEDFTLAREAVYKALAIDPDYARAHASLGMITMSYDNDLAAAARHFERALQLEPANTIIISRATLLIERLGRLDEAISLAEFDVSRDPVSPSGHVLLGLYYSIAGRWDEAIASYRTALMLTPSLSGIQGKIGMVLLLKGEPQAALEAIQLEEFQIFRLAVLSMAYHALGQKDESDAALAEMIEQYEQVAAYNIASVLVYRGEADRAFEWLGKAVEYKDTGLTQIALDPLFANIHKDLRWLPFLESIGMSPEQLDAIEFKVTLPK